MSARAMILAIRVIQGDPCRQYLVSTWLCHPGSGVEALPSGRSGVGAIKGMGYLRL